MAPTQPLVNASGQPQQLHKFYALCANLGRQCLNNYLLSIHPEWSDSEEEEKDLIKQGRKEEKQEREDWHRTKQKQKEEKQLKLKLTLNFPN